MSHKVSLTKVALKSATDRTTAVWILRCKTCGVVMADNRPSRLYQRHAEIVAENETIELGYDYISTSTPNDE